MQSSKKAPPKRLRSRKPITDALNDFHAFNTSLTPRLKSLSAQIKQIIAKLNKGSFAEGSIADAKLLIEKEREAKRLVATIPRYGKGLKEQHRTSNDAINLRRLEEIMATYSTMNVLMSNNLRNYRANLRRLSFIKKNL